MKLSVSLSENDVTTLDQFVQRAGLPSRSAAVQHAIGLLRHPDLEEQYVQAWDEWAVSGEQAVWDLAAADGLGDVAR